MNPPIWMNKRLSRRSGWQYGFRSLLWIALLLASCQRSPTQTPTTTSEPALPTATQAASNQPTEKTDPSTEAPLFAQMDQGLALLPMAQAALDELQTAPRYVLDLVIDPGMASFQVQGNLEYTNNETVSLDSLYLRLLPNGGASYAGGSLTLENLRVNQSTVETRSSLNGSVIEVVLPESLPPGEMVALDFSLQGQVPEGLEEGRTGYGIYGLNDGVLCLAGWYPQVAVYDEDGWNLDPVSAIGDSVYADVAFFDVRVTAPSGLTIAATGVESKREDSGQKSLTYFASGPVREFFLIMGKDFQHDSRKVGDVKVNVYFPPALAAGGSASLDIASRAVEIFNRRFGPYPFTELDIVAAPMQYAAGVEFPGIVLVRTDLYEAPDDPGFLTTTAHEVAHQWWYNTVGNDVFDEPWLDEALTTYSSLIYWQDALGPSGGQGYQTYLQGRYDDLVAKGLDGQVTGSLAYFEELEPLVYARVVYTKGALYFAAVRKEIGDKAFFEALQAYYAAHRFGIATGDDLLAAFESAAGRSLDDLNHTWLDEPVK